MQGELQKFTFVNGVENDLWYRNGGNLRVLSVLVCFFFVMHS